MLSTHLELNLPEWLRTRVSLPLPRLTTVETRMEFVLELARRNIENGTGGPFSAAVVDLTTNELVSVGVNLVTSSGLSSAHAEVVALSMAQAALKTFDLSGKPLQLVTSSEPCSMCLGAFHWSGVRSLALSTRDEDVRAIGFDEGHKPQAWQQTLRARGIEIVEDVLREEGRKVLAFYLQRRGRIYNAG